jgi:hypothetical protein
VPINPGKPAHDSCYVTRIPEARSIRLPTDDVGGLRRECQGTKAPATRLPWQDGRARQDERQSPAGVADQGHLAVPTAPGLLDRPARVTVMRAHRVSTNSRGHDAFGDSAKCGSMSARITGSRGATTNS